MTASPQKQLTGPDLTALEHAFATDPEAEGYHTLAEAYLELGRFTEAMVVCRKRLKSHPESGAPRLLLARIYEGQGKEEKALLELESAIAAAPHDALVLRPAAAMLLRSGDDERGRDVALRAYQADPRDSETALLLDLWGIEAPPIAAPVAVVAAPPPPVVIAEAPAAVTETAPVPKEEISAPVPVPVPAVAKPAPKPRPKIPASREPEPSFMQERDEDAPSPQGNSGAVFLGLMGAALVVLVGFYVWSNHVRETRAAMAAALHDCGEELRNDSYASYKRAAEDAEKVVKLDSSSIAGHAYMAYIEAILWGEHGEGEAAKALALEHLAKAEKLHLEHSHLLAAQALIQFFGGQAAQAQSDLEAKMKDLESKGKNSALLYETLGIIQMRNGDLEKASASLKKALDLSPAEPRIHAAMGDLYRRQGQEINAWNYYDNALRYDRDHAQALLGKALLDLEAERPNYDIAEGLLKRVREATPPPSTREMAMALLLDGIRLDEIGKKAEGQAQEQKGLALDKQNADMHILLGRQMVKDGQFEQGIAEIRQAIALDSKRAGFYVELARAQLQTANGAAAAASSMTTALKTLPNSAKLLGMLGYAQQKSGDSAGAKTTYERVIALDPTAKQPTVRLALARIYHANKAYPKAMELYEKAADDYAGVNSRIAEIYDEEAQMLEEQNAEPAKVLEAFGKAVNADTDYAPSFFYAGKYLSTNKKEKERAKEMLTAYMKLDPTGSYAPSAKALLAKLK